MSHKVVMWWRSNANEEALVSVIQENYSAIAGVYSKERAARAVHYLRAEVECGLLLISPSKTEAEKLAARIVEAGAVAALADVE